jgi:hypothetical protein
MLKHRPVCVSALAAAAAIVLIGCATGAHAIARYSSLPIDEDPSATHEAIMRGIAGPASAPPHRSSRTLRGGAPLNRATDAATGDDVPWHAWANGWIKAISAGIESLHDAAIDAAGDAAFNPLAGVADTITMLSSGQQRAAMDQLRRSAPPGATAEGHNADGSRRAGKQTAAAQILSEIAAQHQRVSVAAAGGFAAAHDDARRGALASVQPIAAGVVSGRRGGRSAHRDAAGNAAADDDEARALADLLLDDEAPHSVHAPAAAPANSVMEARSAEALALAGAGDPIGDHATTRNGYFDFCRSGVVAAAFDPALNFTCLDAASNTNTYINASAFAAGAAALHTNCYPTDASLTRFCVCPLDGVLLRDSRTGTFRCVARTPQCNVSVAVPERYEAAVDDALRRSLARGVPLRVPYAATVDRRSTAPVAVGVRALCAFRPVSEEFANLFSFFSVVNPANAAPPALPLLALFPTTVDGNFSGAVVGTYAALRNTTFVYVTNLTMPTSAPLTATGNTTGGNATTTTTATAAAITPDVFVLSQSHPLVRGGSAFIRPTSFMWLSNANGSAIVRFRDVGGGVLTGMTSAALSFVPADLADHFYAGAQLNVEMGIDGGAGGFRRTSRLVTYDVLNPPPPLPATPAPGLTQSAIIGVSLAGACAAGAVGAIVIGIYRWHQERTRRHLKSLRRAAEREQERAAAAGRP